MESFWFATENNTKLFFQQFYVHFKGNKCRKQISQLTPIKWVKSLRILNIVFHKQVDNRRYWNDNWHNITKNIAFNCQPTKQPKSLNFFHLNLIEKLTTAHIERTEWIALVLMSAALCKTKAKKKKFKQVLLEYKFYC